jgi:hypothetical protein
MRFKNGTATWLEFFPTEAEGQSSGLDVIMIQRTSLVCHRHLDRKTKERAVLLDARTECRCRGQVIGDDGSQAGGNRGRHEYEWVVSRGAGVRC